MSECVCGHQEFDHRLDGARPCDECKCPKFFQYIKTENKKGENMETTFAPEKTKAKTVKSNKPPRELPDMPEKDALGKSADRFRAASNAVNTAKDKLGEAAADLMIEMRRAKRFLIPVDGGTLELKHEAAKEVVKFIRAKAA